MNCPHCGAPPPPGFVPPPPHHGQWSYTCQYCRQTSLQGTPVAPPSHPAPHTGPIYIVMGPGHGHDDDDDDHHHHQQHQYHQAVAHAAAARSMSWIIWVIVVVLVSLGGSGAAFMRCTKHSKIISALVWDGSEPLHCSANEDIAVSGVTANFNAGTAIQAGGNCHVKCIDCNISAQTAIEASGNAEVTIVNGTVKGTSFLAEASGNARVNISGNVVVAGEVKKSSNARVSAPAPPLVTIVSAPAPKAGPPPKTAPAPKTKTGK